MNPLWFVPAVMSVFGGIGEYQSGKEMKKLAAEQELMAQENEQLERRELEEGLRRQRNANAQLRGAAQARAAASGARVEGSAQNYLDYLQTEQAREVNWMQDAGESRIRLNKQAALNEAKALRIQAKSKKYGLVSGLLGGLSMLGAAGLFSSASAGSPNYWPAGS